MNQNKKVRVLQVTSGISAEGIGSFVMNTYENLNRDKVDFSFALATEWEQRFEPKIIKNGDKVYRTYEIGKGISGKVKHFINLVKLLKKEGPFDVVHTHMDFFNGLNVFAAFIARVPVRISHAHKAAQREEISIPKYIYTTLMKALISIFSTHKLGCSESANQYMHGSNFKKNNKIVLFNGINLDRFSVKSKCELKNQLKTNKDNLNFFTIGRIDDQKNPFFIVKIVKELKTINNNIHFYWIGDGSLKGEVKRLVAELGLEDTVTFLGLRDDIAEIISEMDFMLFPSKWEGLPIVLLEAQASGIPCFISDSITYEVDIGLCTVLSLEEEEKEWANKISQHINLKSYCCMINEERLKMFDINNTVRKLEDIYIAST